jgi:hypothetical protein
VQVGEGEVVCFLLVPTSKALRILRRYRGTDPDPSSRCPSPHGYHDASVTSRVVNVHRDRGGSIRAIPDRRRPGDPPWPAACECGYVFRVQDHRQVHEWLLWERADDRTIRYTLRAGGDTDVAPPGAMWDATWMPSSFRGPDGHAWTVRCPNWLDWPIDAVATGGGRWTRTGEAPNLTVNPSINIGSDLNRYHGFLTGGSLTAHLG